MGRDEPRDRGGDDAAWAELVASYGREPAAGAGPWPQAEELGQEELGEEERAERERYGNLAPGARRHPPPGPRDYQLAEDEDDEHFVPPEPPPLPPIDVVSRFAWIAAVGGPVLVVGWVMLGQPVTPLVMVLGVGGFLGGFGALIARMKDRDEDDEDPHGGAVV